MARNDSKWQFLLRKYVTWKDACHTQGMHQVYIKAIRAEAANPQLQLRRQPGSKWRLFAFKYWRCQHSRKTFYDLM